MSTSASLVAVAERRRPPSCTSVAPSRSRVSCEPLSFDAKRAADLVATVADTNAVEPNTLLLLDADFPVTVESAQHPACGFTTEKLRSERA